ncbi:endolytic transglycosylase MltG [Granulicatella seriolae]|uniref:Endolytic murein transglycosylase n=1 Tax=Granulicatella seriolae TaxID=2967226 RepID=A0ABT1WQ08_9LACT|nr:endolytic transglycosylase MltG [Granulicatella seriolae]
MKKKREIKKRPLIGENDSIRDIRQKESSIVRKVVVGVVSVLVALLVIFSIVFYRYVDTNIQPVDASQTQTFEVEIPSGSSVREIADILQTNKVIRNAKIFNYYTKMKNVSEFKAGFYKFSSSMTLDQVITALTGGGQDQSETAAKILIREGDQLKDIAKAVEEATAYTAEEFIAKAQDMTFFNLLLETYPKLLTASNYVADTRYHLEGYLFPATYDVDKNSTLQMIITAMVKKTDEVMSKYYDQIEEKGTDVHKILTMASLVEKEGVSDEDRKLIAGVFYNRIKDDMMLQTDISVLYALDVHKEIVTLQDLEVDSPYNLYKHYGMGPGPYNSPSDHAIQAALNPTDSTYLYFLADTSTGKVYYSETYEQHMELQAKYVDKE